MDVARHRFAAIIASNFHIKRYLLLASSQRVDAAAAVTINFANIASCKRTVEISCLLHLLKMLDVYPSKAVFRMFATIFGFSMLEISDVYTVPKPTEHE